MKSQTRGPGFDPATADCSFSITIEQTFTSLDIKYPHTLALSQVLSCSIVENTGEAFLRSV